VTVYLDTSVLVALFVQDAFSERADEYLLSRLPVLLVSDFAAAEFASAIGRRVRTAELTLGDARMALASFDEWGRAATRRVNITPADIAMEEAFLRRLDLTLRTPDAVHIAAARRYQAAFASFDQKANDASVVLGIEVAAI
jgi:uncharacterized protein